MMSRVSLPPDDDDDDDDLVTPPAEPPKRRPGLRVKRSKRMRPPPWVGAAGAKQLAEQAAAAVGMSTKDLADLMVDSGLGSSMPEEGRVETYTLDDLGMRLWGNLQQLGRTKRAAWFSDLSEVQQDAVLTVLRDRGFHFEVIAKEFDVDVRRVTHAWNTHCDKLGEQVVGTRIQTIVGQLSSHASRAQQMAMEVGDHRSFWQISSELVTMLQSLGVVDRAIQKIDITHHVDDRRAEIDAMIAFERKKEARAEELKLVEVTVTNTDPTPQITVDYDEVQETP